jgi:hypothetical protein
LVKLPVKVKELSGAGQGGVGRRKYLKLMLDKNILWGIVIIIVEEQVKLVYGRYGIWLPGELLGCLRSAWPGEQDQEHKSSDYIKGRKEAVNRVGTSLGLMDMTPDEADISCIIRKDVHEVVGALRSAVVAADPDYGSEFNSGYNKSLEIISGNFGISIVRENK